MKKLIAVAVLVALITPVAAQRARADEVAPKTPSAVDLIKLVDELNKRVAKLESELESSKQSKPSGLWTCSASCGGFKVPFGGGKSRLEGRLLVESRATVAEAFLALSYGCYDYLYVSNNGESIVLASVQNACVFDPNAGTPVASAASKSPDTVAIADNADVKQLPAIEVSGSAKVSDQDGARAI